MERTIADQLLARQGDRKAWRRTRERTWSWDEVVQESAARAAIAREFRADGPFLIGVLLENVPEHIFWLGGAALAGATIAGINPTHRGADLEAQVRHVDCQLIITDRTGWDRLAGLDIAERQLSADDPSIRAELLLQSSSFLVPCLEHEGMRIWDTLAIGEYLHSLFPKLDMVRMRDLVKRNRPPTDRCFDSGYYMVLDAIEAARER